MPARPRQPSKSTSDKAKHGAVPNNLTDDESEEPVPEVRLLGSLHPLPGREERIAISAYWRAAKRQFAPGHELDDWLAAEQEIDAGETTGRQRDE